jgi:predicted Rossmann fold flavoprotein
VTGAGAEAPRRTDVAIVGAGAAGLFAGIWAGRAAQEAGAGLRVEAFDGARRLGAKILVAGGGRCNVTHWRVDDADYAGSTPPAIRKVLRRFGVDETVRFFADLGVELKQEDTGKLFPVSDDAHSVLHALLDAARAAGVRLTHPDRVEGIERTSEGFLVRATSGHVLARRVILCTGGKALPKSGSDGAGLEFARALGHSITDHLIPALVPLRLPERHWITELSGLTVPAELVLRSGTGKKLVSFTDSTLCTHFGLSGPSVLNISRHWTMARFEDPGARLELSWAPGTDVEAVDRALVDAKGRGVGSVLRAWLPERLMRAVCAAADADPAATAQQLPRERRRALAQLVAGTPLPVTGDRGYTFAEAMAGGVPLAEIRLETMESRIVPGLHLAGEVCDVDGRIGGFNFQWAWASGHVAGSSAARALLASPAG